MPFKKGRKKTGGRQKGSLNKVKAGYKAELLGFIVDNFREFVQTLNEIENPAERAKLYLQAAKLVIPQPQQIEIEGDLEIKAVQVQFNSTGIAPKHNESDYIDD